MYGKNPHWITAHYRTHCHRCGDVIIVGSRAYYDPGTKRILCAACANETNQQTEAQPH